MSDANALSYWKTHTYSRHRVDRDIQEFIGWKELGKIFDAIPNETIRDVEVTAFLLAGRITEVLGCYKGMFVIQEDRKRMMVKDYSILKRWKSLDYVVVCKRCNTSNEKFEVICKNCGANLIYGGEKKHKTERVQQKRLPFYFPLNEKCVPFLIKRLDHSTNLLFPSPLSNGLKPYSRKWAYAVLARNEQLGAIAGLDHLYNHWFRAQRLMQLGNERGLDEMELMAFSGIVKSETLSRYSKKVHSYLDKMGIG
jgi:hypothetical protein